MQIRGLNLISSYLSVRSRIPSSCDYVNTLDSSKCTSFMKIYCSCGRIVNLDKREMTIKFALGKEVECPFCRNNRISHEIDELNSLYDGSQIDGEAESINSFCNCQ